MITSHCRQFPREAREAAGIAIRIALLDDEILAFDEAEARELRYRAFTGTEGAVFEAGAQEADDLRGALREGHRRPTKGRHR
jgi:hypothetical protein